MGEKIINFKFSNYVLLILSKDFLLKELSFTFKALSKPRLIDQNHLKD